VIGGLGGSSAQAIEQCGIEVGDARELVIEDRRAVRHDTVGRAERTAALGSRGHRFDGERDANRAWRFRLPAADAKGRHGGGCRGRVRLQHDGWHERRDRHQEAGDGNGGNAVSHAVSQDTGVLPARMRFSICRR
jgi:hypothetical protein